MMRVVILIGDAVDTGTVDEAGKRLTFAAGDTVELPPPVAQSLIANGYADLAGDIEGEGEEDDALNDAIVEIPPGDIPSGDTPKPRRGRRVN